MLDVADEEHSVGVGVAESHAVVTLRRDLPACELVPERLSTWSRLTGDGRSFMVQGRRGQAVSVSAWWDSSTTLAVSRASVGVMVGARDAKISKRFSHP